jgi:hypothetical protein
LNTKRIASLFTGSFLSVTDNSHQGSNAQVKQFFTNLAINFFSVFRNLNPNPSNTFSTNAWLERVIIYGFNRQPKTVKIEYQDKQSAQLQFTYDKNGKVVLIRKPGTNIGKDWSIIID